MCIRDGFPSCGNPDGGVHNFDGKAYPMETHGFADLCAWEVDSLSLIHILFSMTQLYSGRWFSNSRLHMLWVMPSMAS